MVLDEVARDAYLEFYEYDRNFPFEVKLSEPEGKNGSKLYHLAFESAHDEYVPAIYAVPSDARPHPAIVFLHGRGGSRRDILSVAPIFCAAGYAGIGIDCQYHGDRNPRGKNIYSEYVYSNRDAMIQTIVDGRRAVDFLQSRPEVDQERIGLVGGSMGGILGTLLAAVERRIKASVLIVAGGNWEVLASKSQHGDAKALRRKGVDAKLFARAMASVDPVNFVDLISPRPVLFQLGLHDDVVPAETGRLLVEAAKEPKEVDWYDSGHGVPLDRVVPRVMSWLEKNLKDI